MTGTGYPAGYPAQGISEVLSFQTIAAGGFKQGVPDFSGGKATLQARCYWPLQVSWREGAGGSAGAGSHKNQTHLSAKSTTFSM